MRLDQFLRRSRLVLRRPVAQELCEAGAVAVNGVPARSSRTIREGDRITITRRDHSLSVRVCSVPSSGQTSRKEAPELYEIISEEMHRESRKDGENPDALMTGRSS